MTGDGHVTESKIAEQSRQVIENKDGPQVTVDSSRLPVPAPRQAQPARLGDRP